MKSHPSRSHPGFQASDVQCFFCKMTWRGSWWLFLVDGRGADHFIEHHCVYMCLSKFHQNQGFLTISSNMVWYVLVYTYHMQIEANWVALNLVQQASIFPPKPMVLVYNLLKTQVDMWKATHLDHTLVFKLEMYIVFYYKMTWRGSWWLFLVDGRGADHFIEHHCVYMCLSKFHQNQGFLTISSKMVWYVLVYTYHMQIEANWVALNLIQQASIFPPKPMVLAI